MNDESIVQTRKTAYRRLILIAVGILILFVVRTIMAASYRAPRLFDLFDSLTVLGALAAAVRWRCSLHRCDWLAALGLGAFIGATLPFTTLFSAYPLFDVVRGPAAQAVQRGLFTFILALGGFAIMRQGGPVLLYAADGSWKKATRGILAGLAVGLPLAVVNVFALQITEGQSIQWQSPLAAVLDALHPGIVEEVIYRFALWGLLWLALHNTLSAQSAALAGLLATFVHGFAHFDALFVQLPLAALGMGIGITLIWGMPPFFLARRKGLEAAVAFHWIQDAARFLTGF